MTVRYALFDTPLGTCAIAWGEEGIRGLGLPEASREKLIERLLERAGGPAERVRAVPSFVSAVIAKIARHLSGHAEDFGDLALDLGRMAPFHRAVVEAARRVPAGRVVTYGELAALAGSPGAARAVGRAMAQNPFPIVVPCHRVRAAGGRPGGFSAFGGLETKRRLLSAEGVLLPGRGSLFDGAGRLPFDGPGAVRALRAADPELAALVGRVGRLRLRLEAMSSPFEALAEAIIFQQLSGRAAATILGRFKGLFGGRPPTPEELAATSGEALRAAGLSRPKQRALHDLAAKAAEGVVPSLEALGALSDEAIVERLTAVRGVGRWTVEMLLIFRLGRPDVLPVSDLGIRKGFARMTGSTLLPEPAQVARRGERWRPFRTAAAWYLWRSLET